jgi:hypothetical protein
MTTVFLNYLKFEVLKLLVTCEYRNNCVLVENMSRRNFVNTAKVIQNTHTPTAGSAGTLNHYESLKINNRIVVFLL